MPLPPPLLAPRSYAALEPLDDVLPPTAAASAASQQLQQQHVAGVGVSGVTLDAGPCGPEEHRIDAFQLRNEAGFINDFRDDVTERAAARLARRRSNCAGLTVVSSCLALALLLLLLLLALLLAGC